MLMPWILKALFILARSRRFAAGVAAIELAQGDRARKLYASVRERVSAAPR